MLKFQTFSVIAGSEACNARCNFCISAMTPSQGVTLKKEKLNTFNLDIACKLAEKSGVTTALITSKGEPTLFPDDIDIYLSYLNKYFPLIELQTNAINFTKDINLKDKALLWCNEGLRTVIISIIHYNNDCNREIYCDSDDKYRMEYPDLSNTISLLHDIGFSVRLSCVGCKGYIDTKEELENLVSFCKENNVEQLTWRPVVKPDYNNKNDKIYNATTKLQLDDRTKMQLRDYVSMNGKLLMKLIHNAEVFDFRDQNLCMSNCLTLDPNEDVLRQLIYFPDGHIRYDWQYQGAIIL